MLMIKNDNTLNHWHQEIHWLQLITLYGSKNSLGAHNRRIHPTAKYSVQRTARLKTRLWRFTHHAVKYSDLYFQRRDLCRPYTVFSKWEVSTLIQMYQLQNTWNWFCWIRIISLFCFVQYGDRTLLGFWPNGDEQIWLQGYGLWSHVR